MYYDPDRLNRDKTISKNVLQFEQNIWLAMAIVNNSF